MSTEKSSGVITYRTEDDNGKDSAVGFGVHFSQKILDGAYTFDGIKKD